MNLFESFAEKCFTDLLKAGTITVAHGIRKTYHELDIQDKQELDAKIEKIFGNEFPDQLIAIKSYVKNRITESQQAVQLELLKGRVHNTFDNIKDSLDAAQLTYDNFIRNKCPFTWNEFKNSPNLSVEMNRLFKWITIESVSKKKLFDDLMVICDMDVEKYKDWQQAISLTFSQGYFLRTALHFHTVFPEESYLPELPERPTELPDYVRDEMKDMNEHTQKVVAIMNKKYRELKANFLLKSCGDDEHKKCGSDNNENCSELGSKVHKALKTTGAMQKTDAAHKIADSLREAYTNFQWSVVVLDNYQQVELQVNHEHISNIWLQRSGTKPQGFLEKPAKENFIMSNSLGSYGYLMCYLIRNPTKRAALIFWIDKNVINSNGFVMAHDRLKRKWESDQELRTMSECKGAGGVYRVTGKIKETDINYVFAVGLYISTTEKIIGMDLAKDENQTTFPLCLGTPRGCTLICPESLTSSLPLDLTLTKTESIRDLSFVGGNFRATVYQARLQKGSHEEMVAVKEVSLPADRENEQLQACQISILDASFHFLKKFKHLNVVKYLEFQPYMPTDKWLSPAYRIIMEFYAGGSLTDTVKEDANSPRMFEWGHNVLSGLAYLHEQNIAHKAIQGDHLLFQGPGKGTGNLKIVSVGRISDILTPTVMSYPSRCDSSIILFQPPEVNKRFGRKTDIWSFGCVLIQMISGKLPDLELVSHSQSDNGTPEKVKKPKIPEGIPTGLLNVIEQCLDLDYDKRPSAAALLGQRFFNKHAQN